eukprot:s126_g25.t1
MPGTQSVSARQRFHSLARRICVLSEDDTKQQIPQMGQFVSLLARRVSSATTAVSQRCPAPIGFDLGPRC